MLETRNASILGIMLVLAAHSGAFHCQADERGNHQPRKVFCPDPDPLFKLRLCKFRFTLLVQGRDKVCLPWFHYTTSYRKQLPGGVFRAICVYQDGGHYPELNLMVEPRKYWIRAGDVVALFDELFVLANPPAGAVFYRITDLVPEEQRPTSGAACFSAEPDERWEGYVLNVWKVSRDPKTNEPLAIVRATISKPDGLEFWRSGTIRAGDRICRTTKKEIRTYKVSRIVPGFPITLSRDALRAADIPAEHAPKRVRGWVEIDPLPESIRPRIPGEIKVKDP